MIPLFVRSESTSKFDAYTNGDYDTDACLKRAHIVSKRTKCEVPRILHMCHESRIVGLRHYSLGLKVLLVSKSHLSLRARPCKHEITTTANPRGLYIDMERDIIHLQGATKLPPEATVYMWRGRRSPLVFGRVKYLVMETDLIFTLLHEGGHIRWDQIDMLLIRSFRIMNFLDSVTNPFERQFGWRLTRHIRARFLEAVQHRAAVCEKPENIGKVLEMPYMDQIEE